MRACLLLLALILIGTHSVGAQESATDDEKKSDLPHALNFKMKSLDGKDVDLATKYKDKMVLIVNVASKCGLTPQYEQLQELHAKYAKKGLAIIGFPCNQFGKQEPGTAAQIQAFCKKNYAVEFDLMSKIEVHGDGQCELYKYLTSIDTQPVGKGKIKWNFEKFLVNKDGEVVARYGPRTRPDDKAVIAMIEQELGTKK